MSELEALQRVSDKVDLAIEVLLVESLHGNAVVTMVPGSVDLAVEAQIVLDWAACVSRFGVLTWCHRGGDGPEGHEDGNCCEDGKEEHRPDTASHRVREVAWDSDEGENHRGQREAIVAAGIGWYRAIFDRRVLPGSVGLICARMMFKMTYIGRSHTAVLRRGGTCRRRSFYELELARIEV